LIKKEERNCPYVNNGHSSVGCSVWQYEPEKCKTCGWHPEEHARRVAAIRAGEVKTFLTITASAFQNEKNGFKQKEARHEDL
jgi:hypothetical protein